MRVCISTKILDDVNAASSKDVVHFHGVKHNLHFGDFSISAFTLYLSPPLQTHIFNCSFDIPLGCLILNMSKTGSGNWILSTTTSPSIFTISKITILSLKLLRPKALAPSLSLLPSHHISNSSNFVSSIFKIHTCGIQTLLSHTTVAPWTELLVSL